MFADKEKGFSIPPALTNTNFQAGLSGFTQASRPIALFSRVVVDETMKNKAL